MGVDIFVTVEADILVVVKRDVITGCTFVPVLILVGLEASHATNGFCTGTIDNTLCQHSGTDGEGEDDCRDGIS